MIRLNSSRAYMTCCRNKRLQGCPPPLNLWRILPWTMTFSIPQNIFNSKILWCPLLKMFNFTPYFINIYPSPISLLTKNFTDVYCKKNSTPSKMEMSPLKWLWWRFLLYYPYGMDASDKLKGSGSIFVFNMSGTTPLVCVGGASADRAQRLPSTPLSPSVRARLVKINSLRR